MPQTAQSTDPHLEFVNEALESRLLLTSGVRVVNHHGDVTITGDHAANHIGVAMDLAGTYYVQGFDGTKVNGATNGVVPVELTDDLRIHLKHGNNSLTMAGISVPDDLVIRTGHGDDQIRMYLVGVGDDVTVHTGGGTDSFGASIQVEDDFRLYMHGDATIDLLGYFLGDVRITSGHGEDDINFYSSIVVGNTSVLTRGGDDTVLLDGVDFFGNLTIHGHAGDDNITVQRGDIHGKLKVVTHAGDDSFVYLGPDATAYDDIFVSMGAGRDGVLFTARLSNDITVRVIGNE